MFLTPCIPALQQTDIPPRLPQLQLQPPNAYDAGVLEISSLLFWKLYKRIASCLLHWCLPALCSFHMFIFIACSASLIGLFRLPATGFSRSRSHTIFRTRRSAPHAKNNLGTRLPEQLKNILICIVHTGIVYKQQMKVSSNSNYSYSLQ